MPDCGDDHAKRIPNSRVRDDFNDAIDRLERGKPRNTELRAAAKRGSLKINYSTVAKEAGRSRTLIAIPGEKCAYPEIRDRIENLKKPVNNPTDSNETIKSLRAQVKELNEKVTNQQHQRRADQTARTKAEEDRDRWKKAYDRLLEKIRQEAPAHNVISLVRGDQG